MYLLFISLTWKCQIDRYSPYIIVIDLNYASGHSDAAKSNPTHFEKLNCPINVCNRKSSVCVCVDYNTPITCNVVNSLILPPPSPPPTGPPRPICADLYRSSIFEPSPERYGLPVMSMSQFLLPRTGLDFLYGIPSLSLEQTFELHECKPFFSFFFFLFRLFASRKWNFLNYLNGYIFHWISDAGSSENRFIIRTDRKEAIYTATESSTARDRMVCGSAR